MMRYLKWFLTWLFACLPLQLIGIPLVAIAVLCQPHDSEKLPKFLKWFDLADNYPDEFGRSNETYVKQILPAGKWARFNYIALRNPTNYFNYKYLATKILRIQTFISVRDLQSDYKIDPAFQLLYLQDIGDNGVSGGSDIEIDCITVDDVETTVWEYYKVYRYKFFGNWKCVRIRLGWKLSDIKEENLGKYLQWVFVISPFHDFTGKLPNA